MNSEDREKNLDVIRRARASTSDSDPWEASSVSFLLSEIDRRDEQLTEAWEQLYQVGDREQFLNHAKQLHEADEKEIRRLNSRFEAARPLLVEALVRFENVHSSSCAESDEDCFCGTDEWETKTGQLLEYWKK